MVHLDQIVDNIKEKDIIIFNSPLYRDSYDDGETYLPPIGQGYILTRLNQENISAGLVDAVYNRLGVRDIVNIINNGTFKTVGFNIFSVNMDIVKEIISNIERKVHVILGGKAIGAIWKDIITWDVNNYLSLIIGEGELIIPDIVRNVCKENILYEAERCKVYYVGNKSCYFPENLDNICLDNFLFKDRAIYNHYGRLEQCIITSRGCIYNCAFCSGSRYSNPDIPVRVRSNKSIEEEIERILEITPGIESIRVLDDLFLKNVNSIKSASHIFSCFSELHWRAMAHIQSFINAEDYISDLKKCGCDELFIGIESGSSKIRTMIHKEGTTDMVMYVVKMLLRKGIDVKGYFICGFPKETEDDLCQTLKLVEDIKSYSNKVSGNFRAVAFRFRPYHGTELYDNLLKSCSAIDYYKTKVQKGTKTQYNFSAGNFSYVTDKIIDDYIERIANDGNDRKLSQM